jgi:hypothetical protein
VAHLKLEEANNLNLRAALTYIRAALVTHLGKLLASRAMSSQTCFKFIPSLLFLFSSPLSSRSSSLLHEAMHMDLKDDVYFTRY